MQIERRKIFYISEAATRFWSVSTLEHYIASDLFSQQGKLPNNFEKTLPEQLQPTALKIFQDEYLMDFMTSGEVEDERVMEEKVVSDIKNFIMKMGQGFSFISNQYRLELDGEEFFIDLLFFNRHLVSSNIEIKICKDICNGTKHLAISTPRIDKDFAIFRDYKPFHKALGMRSTELKIYADGQNYSLPDLMFRCIKAWDNFISTELASSL
jgi:predicted nuclease of restriction endonuclease-like (RecB) superfamily